MVPHYHSMSPDELAQYWDTTTPKLFGYLVNVLRDKTVAEDVFQNTWLKAIKALPNFQSNGNKFKAWLFAIARNECKQLWRKSNREVPIDSETHDIPDNNSENQQNGILMNQIISRLSEDDREILRLRYIADLPINDIAKILNLNFVTVRVRIHRALARARSQAVTQLPAKKY